MKRLITLLAAVVVAIAMSPMASAQGKHGRGETKANPNGQRGIENAEAKQAEQQQDKAQGKTKKQKKHKGQAKGKQK
jgi:Ni/Co efflux regulator RcnB